MLGTKKKWKNQQLKCPVIVQQKELCSGNPKSRDMFLWRNLRVRYTLTRGGMPEICKFQKWNSSSKEEPEGENRDGTRRKTWNTSSNTRHQACIPLLEINSMELLVFDCFAPQEINGSRNVPLTWKVLEMKILDKTEWEYQKKIRNQWWEPSCRCQYLTTISLICTRLPQFPTDNLRLLP